MDLLEIKSDIYGYEFAAGDIQELKEWCHRQSDFYNLIIQQPSRIQQDPNFQQTRSQCQALGSLRGLADQLSNQDEQSLDGQVLQLQTQHLSQIRTICETAFNQFQLPPADSEIVLNLKILLETDPTIAIPALFSLSRFSGQPNQQFSHWYSEIWRGLGIGSFLSAQQNLQTKPEKYAKAYRELVNSAQADFARTREKLDKAIFDLNGQVSSFEKQVLDFNESHESRLTQTTQDSAQTLDDVKKEINDYKLFVKQEIALQAPVTYWEDKAVGHENLAFLFGWVTVILMFLSGVGAFHSTNFVKEIVGTGTSTNYAGIAVVSVLVTLTFWVLRLSVRLFLSQQHLSVDARERTAMVKTYLALKEAGVAPNGGDLTPVLVALFRGSSDGIVKDEAMPAVLADILTRTK